MIPLLMLSLLMTARAQGPAGSDPGSPAVVSAALTLDEVRILATRRSLEVEAAEARAQAARGDAVASWSGHLPAVTGFASGSIGSGRTASGFDRPTGSQLGVGLSASWNVIAPGSWAAAAAARRSARGQEAMAAWTRVEARRVATRAFADAVAAHEAVEALSQALEDARVGADATEQLVRAGIRPSAEGARARADAAAVEARLRAAEGNRAAACAQLLGLVRQAPAARCNVRPPSWGVLDTTPRSSEEEHPAITAAREAVAAADADQSGAWLERAPTLAATGTAATWSADGGEFAPGWSAGLSVELPILTGGASLGSIQGERARAEVAIAELALQQQDLDIARVGAEARFQSSRASLDAQLAAYDAAAAAFDMTDERFRAGLDPLQAWLDARRDRDTAAVTLADARRELLTALAEVESARGIW